jgi:hypothetical protein
MTTEHEIGARWESRAHGVCISVEKTGPRCYMWSACFEDGTGHRFDWDPTYKAASESAHIRGYFMARRKDMPRLRRVKPREG